MLPIEEVDLERVLLDLENYRIPNTQQTEADAFEYLFASENVMELVELIAHNGYLDNEIPLVVPAPTEGGSEGSYIVLEGNRRVAALKALTGYARPTAFSKKLAKIEKKYTHELKQLPRIIRVMVISSREEALPHLGRMHIGDSKRRWTRDQQATFFYSMLDETTDVSILKQKYPKQAIKRLMKMASARRFISNVSYDDETLQSYASSPDLTMSTFEYAYNREEIADAVGLTFNSDGLIEPSPEAAGKNLAGIHKSALESLLTMFRAKELNTRSKALKSGTPELHALVGKITEIPISGSAPDSSTSSIEGQTVKIGSASGTAKNHSIFDETGSSAAEKQNNTPTIPIDNRQGRVDIQSSSSYRTPTNPRKRERLDTGPLASSFERSDVPMNLKTLYTELSQINLGKFPVAAGLLMRAFLEAIVRTETSIGKNSKNAQLKALLSQLQQVARKEKWQCLGGLNSIADSSAQTPGALAWFNGITHDVNRQPAKENLHEAWGVVYPVIIFLMNQEL